MHVKKTKINLCWRRVMIRQRIKHADHFPVEHLELEITNEAGQKEFAVSRVPAKGSKRKDKIQQGCYVAGGAKVCSASGHTGFGFISRQESFRGRSDWMEVAMKDSKFMIGLEEGSGADSDKSKKLHSIEAQNQFMKHLCRHWHTRRVTCQFISSHGTQSNGARGR